MSYFGILKENCTLKESLWEIPASFVFVIAYFLLTTKFLNVHDISSVILSSLLFSALWFLEVKIFSLKAKVHILPVFSFIESLGEDDFTSFIFRLPGQFLGAVLAILVVSFGAETDYTALYQFQLITADSFLLGIFTGFISQIIYLIYYILFYKTKLAGGLKLLLLSAGMGVLFFTVAIIGNISLLNPFGILLSSLLNGHTVSLNAFLTGSIIHVIVPMFFIAGTHYFLKGFILKEN